MTSSAYIIGGCAGVILLIIAALISVAITYQPDKSDIKSRRIWFWVLAFLTPVITFLSAYFFVYADIHGTAKREAYMTAMCIATGVSFVLYILLGFILAKANSKGKLGNWF